MIGFTLILAARFFYWHALCSSRDVGIIVRRTFNIRHRAQRGKILDADGSVLARDSIVPSLWRQKPARSSADTSAGASRTIAPKPPQAVSGVTTLKMVPRGI